MKVATYKQVKDAVKAIKAESKTLGVSMERTVYCVIDGKAGVLTISTRGQFHFAPIKSSNGAHNSISNKL
jgi:hypothetical protein